MSNQRIIPINIEEEMKSAYIDYSMSVIISRALPDVRDGLKPVHRRVLYGMQDLGLTYNKSYKKSARIVGEVLGKYHPHGDSSVYDTMVRMAQWWSLRYPLVDGQGNFGSMDGDSPAAMRYTEARLRRIADEILADIKKETVDFELNFDDSLEEPTVLPTRMPNLLVNGASGIAVGMATNMMPHNLPEVCQGIEATIDNPEITIDELMQYIKAPDFPTGGIIYGTSGVREAFHTGRGRIVLRARTEIENLPGNRERIVVTEIPYQINKARLVAKIADLVNNDKVQGISDIRDESDRDGLRIVIDIKKDAMATVVLNMLFKHSDLQTSYGVNNVALVRGRPMTLNLKDLIEEFIDFRLEVIQRRTRYDLRKAKERAHILEGLLIALDHLDEVIALIRASATVDEAREGLMERFELSEVQAKAILDMRLQKLTGLEREKVKQEYDELLRLIEDLEDILANEDRQRGIIKTELAEIVEKYGDERRTDIVAADGEINMEDLIKEEDVVITISHFGYIKRTPVSEYRTQGRGGRGSRGSKTRDEDFIEHMFVASTHNYLLLFTESGQCHWLRVYEIPEAGKTSSGRVIQNILAIPKEDRIKAYIKIKDLTDEAFLQSHYIVLATAQGLIKKTSVEAFSRPRSNGIIAINIREGDSLLEAKLTNGHSQIFLANRSGYAIRFEEDRVRAMGRTAAGVRGMSLNESDDAVIGMVCVDTAIDHGAIMVISKKGNGKRTELDEYRLTNRGGKGVKTMQITDKTGPLVGMKYVYAEDDVMISTRNGITIRIHARDISQLGRATQGVRMVRLGAGDEIADLAVVRYNPEEDSLLEEE